MWNVDGLPLVRAAMSRDRFSMMLRFIRFDNENTRAERVQKDKANKYSSYNLRRNS